MINAEILGYCKRAAFEKLRQQKREEPEGKVFYDGDLITPDKMMDKISEYFCLVL